MNVLAIGSAVLALAAPSRPNVVLITIDTLRADHVGAYGAGPGSTPALDALAAEGLRFANAISPVPLTRPAHASLLTGLTRPSTASATTFRRSSRLRSPLWRRG